MKTKIDPSTNPTVERHIRGFLHDLNSSGGKPLETLTPRDAREVLVSAQKVPGLTLPPCDVEDRMIQQDGLHVQKMRLACCRSLCSFTAADGSSAIIRRTSASSAISWSTPATRLSS